MSRALTVFERSRWPPSSAITPEHRGCRACSSPSAAISLGRSLLTTWGNLDLGHFWLRRARRWFINDGIHFTTRGYAERGKRTAEALATAFPKQGSSPGECLIRP